LSVPARWVAALERVDDVVGRGRARNGRRGDGGDDADRPCDLDQSTGAVLCDHTDGSRAGKVAQQAHGLASVLGDLVVDIT
jgi:hypothetical protein